MSSFWFWCEETEHWLHWLDSFGEILYKLQSVISDHLVTFFGDWWRSKLTLHITGIYILIGVLTDVTFLGPIHSFWRQLSEIDIDNKILIGRYFV